MKHWTFIEIADLGLKLLSSSLSVTGDRYGNVHEYNLTARSSAVKVAQLVAWHEWDLIVKDLGKGP